MVDKLYTNARETVQEESPGTIKEAPELCEDSCSGSDSDISTALQQQMISDALVNALADVFKTLGDPTRVKIIYALMQSELCVHDISVILNMGQSAVSHQLRYLRNMRIVKRRKSGKTVYYSLDDSHVEQIFVQTLQHVKHE